MLPSVVGQASDGPCLSQRSDLLGGRGVGGERQAVAKKKKKEKKSSGLNDYAYILT